MAVFYERRPENLYVGVICDHPFPCHVHDVAEIICLQTGSVDMTIGGERIRLTPGDAAMVFPSIPHSYAAVSEDASGLTLIFTTDVIAEYTRTFRTMRPASPLLTAAEMPEELPMIIGRLSAISPEEDSPFRLAWLHLFVAYALSAVTLQPVDKSMLTGMTSQVLHYVSSHFTEPLSLESTARVLGISRIHLSHIFSQQLHINFRQYVNSLRSDMACNLLRDPENSISQVAWKCGYGNLRTFHRAFLSQVGMPPNQYRRRYLGDAAPDEEDYLDGAPESDLPEED